MLLSKLSNNETVVILEASMKFVTQENTFASVISNKLEKDVIFELIIIKPSNQQACAA